jgi:excisionase family DNA binding protein
MSVSPPRLALKVEEAAAALGVSRDFFDEHVRDELRLIRRGRLVLVPVRELERWIAREAALAVGEEQARR